MAYTKKTPKVNETFVQLKKDLQAGAPGTAYVFYGEESYLRTHYLGMLRKCIINEGFADFNDHTVEGKALSVPELTGLVEAMPMMAERTLVVVNDFDIFKLGDEQRTQFIAMIEDVPEYCCLVFVYDTVDYKPNRTMKKLYKAVSDHVAAVEFRSADSADLVVWIGRRFKALGKAIDRQTAEYLIFTCGSLMTGLVPEIMKIATYAKGDSITQKDIDAVADPVLSAEVFRLSDAVLQGDTNRAGQILVDLLKMQEEPIMILAVLGNQLRRIHTARLAIDSGKDRAWLMDLWEMKSEYPAKLLMASARKTDLQWCADSVKRCQVLDKRLKSERGIDPAGELKQLIIWLGANK